KFKSGRPGGGMVKMEPACARKLVEGAVAYAHELGFAPHPDYQTAKVIFGDIDSSQCEEEFEYGKDGKPFFFAGPNDSPARCRQILDTLARTRGQGNFHFTMPVGPGAFEDLTVAEEEEDEPEGWGE